VDYIQANYIMQVGCQQICKKKVIAEEKQRKQDENIRY
jgi:hypothetical protein